MTLKKEITEQVRELLRQHPNGLSIAAIVRQIGINRNTVGRYLENLMVSGQVEMRHFGMAKIYRLARRVPLPAMLSITSQLIMLVDSSLRVKYANEPMLSFLGTNQKDFYNRNIEYTPCITVFDDAFDLIRKNVRRAINGKEWSGEIALRNGAVTFSCHITPAVFEEGERGASVLLEDITVRKMAEAALRESEDRYRTLVEISPDAILLHQDGKIVYMNPAALALVRATRPQDIIGKSVLDIIHPDFREKILLFIKKDLEGYLTPLVELTLLRLDGTSVIVEGRGVRTLIMGSPAIQVTLRDVTDRKKAEETLRKSEARYRSLAEASHDLIFVIGRNDTVEYANSHAAALFGTTPDRIIGQNRAGLFPGTVGERQAGRLRDVFQTGRPVRSEGAMPVEGRLRWFDHSLIPIPDNDGHVVSVLGISRDITERRQTEEELRASEATARALINAPTDSVLLLDINGMILDVNETAVQRLGKAREELIGARSDSVLPDAIARIRRERIEKVVLTKQPVRFEDQRDGTWFDTVAYPILDRNGEVVRLAIIARDITESKKTGEALRQSEERLRNIIENSSNLFYSSTPDHRFTYISPRIEAILGYKPDDTWIRWTNLITNNPANRRGLELTNRAIDTGIRQPPYEVEVFAKDGRTVWLEINEAPVVVDGRTVAIVGAAQDVTAKKLAQEALRIKEEEFRLIAEYAVDIIIRVAPDGKIVYASPALKIVLGYGPADILGLSVLEYLHPDDLPRIQDLLAGMGRSMVDTGMETFRIRHHDGTYIPFETTFRVIRDPQTGLVKEFYTVSRDIRARNHG